MKTQDLQQKPYGRKPGRALPRYTAWRLVGVTAASIFLAEALIMGAAPFVPLSQEAWTLLDPIVLILVLLPVLYAFLYRPLTVQREARLRTEAVLSQEREQLLSIFNGMDEVVYIADPVTYELLYMNEPFRRQWGDGAGGKCHAVLQNRDTPCPFCSNDRIFGEHLGKTHIWEFQNEVNSRWYRCIDRAIHWPDERMVRFEIAIDVTDMKEAEEKRRLLDSRMQYLQKQESLALLAGGIAHDFNNLLVGVMGNADLALFEVPPGSPLLPCLKDIKKASARLADLTRQMLAYSGKGRFVVGPVDLSGLVKDMAQLLEVTISKSTLMRFNLEADLPVIEADATQIRQVVMNLIVNASEAMGEEGGVIELHTSSVSATEDYLSTLFPGQDLPAGLYVCLEISDTGCGISVENTKKIFDPFFSTKFTGRGLGLAAVLGILNGHRAGIKVYSEPNRGTSFKLFFPSAESPREHLPVRGSSGATSPLRGTVLVADDDDMVLTVAKRMLERFGLSVLCARDGREALELLAQHEGVSVVLLDLTMPHMDGIEAFREIRQLRPGLPVILSSGYNEKEATSRFSGTGLDGFIQKPYEVRTLAEILRGVLGTTGTKE